MASISTAPDQCRVRVKICGVTSVEDAAAAVRCGADAIGLNFFEPSPRYVHPDRAREIARVLPPFISRVGVFVNAADRYVEQVTGLVGLDLLQFHGDETPAQCERFGRAYLKSIAVRPGSDVEAVFEAYSSASGVMLDAWHEQLRGGSGETFDWSLVPGNPSLPIVLAGGLNVDNVSRAVTQVRPFAVDVCGGVELSRGVKDVGKMAAFVHAVRETEMSLRVHTEAKSE
tara:strand:+ start:474 stop:1160 length:687 start_codon:yes stop_codon:yes gene_type:complete